MALSFAPGKHGSWPLLLVWVSAVSSRSPFSLHIKRDPLPGWTSLGCYTDSVGARTLSANEATSVGPSAMTHEACQTACQSGGFIIAGLEFSTECWCGNALQNNAAVASDGGCTMACSGNATEMCGGSNRLNLFQYGSGELPTSGSSSSSSIPATSTNPPTVSTTGSPAPPGSLPAGWSYRGCYVDNPNGNGRVMGSEISTASNITGEYCVQLCASAGYSVAGTEYSTQCFCDNALRNGAPTAPDSDCNMACGGNAGETCGGPSRLSVYSNTAFTVYPVPTAQTTNLPGSWQYVGCLTDSATGSRTFPYQLEYPQNNSATACLAQCAAYGFGAGGMEYGQECWCGDAANVASVGATLRPESECTTYCPGNGAYLCGGGNRLTYYQWTGTPLQTWAQPTGNGAGQYQFLIGGVVIPLISTLNINGKVSFVEKHGTGPPNSTGAYELDLTHVDNSSLAFRPMHVQTDVFCSASLILPDRRGRQINVGGWSGTSLFGVRLYTPDGSPGVAGVNDWHEDASTVALQVGRWYPAGMIMANGSILIVGGENGSNGPPVPSLELLPAAGEPLFMDWLNRTDPNNLYPFLAVLPGGGIFVAYYNEARILDERTFGTSKVLPNIPGAVNNPAGGRTYPLEGTMVLLPQYAPYTDPVTVLICGGSTPFGGDAIDNCVSIQPDAGNPQWTIERMPSKRVMTCMAALPDGTYLILNGALQGQAGFGLGKNPNLAAVLYDPSKPVNQRMSMMATTIVARMYHSEAITLQDGRVLVTGSDPQDNVNPQEYRVEVFIPPYLLTGLPRPTFSLSSTDWAYGASTSFSITSFSSGENIKISLLGAVSSTHGNSFGQRTMFPAWQCSGDGSQCNIVAPPNAHTAPPGWYQMFVLDRGVPSISQFVRIGGDPANLGLWPNATAFSPLPGV